MIVEYKALRNIMEILFGQMVPFDAHNNLKKHHLTPIIRTPING
jgi:hypothetical protein